MTRARLHPSPHGCRYPAATLTIRRLGDARALATVATPAAACGCGGGGCGG